MPLFVHTVSGDRIFVAGFVAAFAQYRARVPGLLPRWRKTPPRTQVRSE